jgi:hypothetical protein
LGFCIHTNSTTVSQTTINRWVKSQFELDDVHEDWE